MQCVYETDKVLTHLAVETAPVCAERNVEFPIYLDVEPYLIVETVRH